MIYNVMVTSEPVPPDGEFEYDMTVELLGDDNPEFDIPNGPHHLRIDPLNMDDFSIPVIDAKVREWLREKFGIES